jgi:hypothetical protein
VHAENANVGDAMRFLILSALLLSGCMTSTGFQKSYAENYCERWDDCIGLEAIGSSLEQCVDDIYEEWQDDDCDDFNAESAAECLDGMEGASCTGFLGASLSGNCQVACE